VQGDPGALGRRVVQVAPDQPTELLPGWTRVPPGASSCSRVFDD
jgi:hypothetical protein